MDYQPKPISTVDVRLNPQVLELTEWLAKNTHELWAQQRFADGWRFGPRRDDAVKQHPGLVPYEQLSESEKEYDRGTALGTLKAMLALGYRIERDGPAVRRMDSAAPVSPSKLVAPDAAPQKSPVVFASPSSKDILPWDPGMLDQEVGGSSAFRADQTDAIRRRVELFNEDAAQLRKTRPNAPTQSKRRLLTEAEERAAPPEAKVVLERYALADQLALSYRQKSDHAFRDLFIVAFLATTVFEVVGHGLHGEAGHWLRSVLLALYLLFWGLAALRWNIAWSGGYQDRYLDYRALAEGLRVQFFWRLLGIREAVDEYYLGLQRNELEWIRYGLRKWRTLDDEQFPSAARDNGDHRALVRRRWVQEQLRYFGEAIPAEEKKDRKCRRDGKALFAVNMVAVVCLLVIPLVAKAASSGEGEQIGFAIADGAVFLLASLSLVVAALRIAYAEKMAFAEHAKEFEMIRDSYAHAESRLAAGESLDPFRELGREALSENGDWLLTHRERPLEVPIP